MELNIKDEKTFVLPEKCLDMLDVADGTDLKVLIYIASLGDKEFDTESAAEFLQISVEELNASVKFWSGASVIKRGKKTAAKKSEPKKTVREKRVMHLTTDELSSLGEKNAEFRTFLDVAQQTAGWIFNTAEIEIVASLYANLDLSTEYILSLIGYYICKKEQNLRYLEKVAYSFVDEGITTLAALEEKLRQKELSDSREGKIRSMFGIGTRKLTAKEQSLLAQWFDEYKASDELIALAYEKTVNATGKVSIPYAGSILAAWHEKGIKTPDEVGKIGSKPQGGAKPQSFDVEDVFNRAIDRSYKNGGKK